MSKQQFTPGLLLCVVLLFHCKTEDPRVEVLAGSRPVTSGSGDAPPGGLGALCVEARVECDEGLSCYGGTCTPEAYVEACTPNPCGENGICNARGEVDDEGAMVGGAIALICRCPAENEQWNGTTCLASSNEGGYPQFSGSTLDPGQTCPGPDEQIGVPGATDCSGEAFCDSTENGSCLEYNFSLVGELEGRAVQVESFGEEETTVECIREYFETEQAQEGAELDGRSGQNYGLKLVIRGALAEEVAPGESSITMRWWNGPVLDGASLLVFPQTNAPAPRSDSVFGSLGFEETELAALGGRVALNSVSGPDEDGDDQIDNDEGTVGGTFFLGLPDEQFVAGAFVVPCGDNESVPLSGP